MMNASCPRVLVDRPSRQQGFVLILGMVFLVILTLLGISNMRISMMEERMTGGFNDRANLAFESAEFALREAEAFLESGGVVGAAAGTYSYANRKLDGDRSAFWSGTTCSATSFNWSNGTCGYASASRKLDGTAEIPRYVIEDYADAIISNGSFRSGIVKQTVKVYRVTARGVGGQASTAVILQTTYKR